MFDNYNETIKNKGPDKRGVDTCRTLISVI